MTTEAVVQPAASAELIAGKYKSVDDLVTAYKALESKLGSTTSAPATPVSDPLNPPAQVGADGLSIEKPPAPIAGNALEAAYAKSMGAPLTEADYTALQAQGFSRNIVDAHIQGRDAVFNNAKNSVLAAAGGAEKYAVMATWAAANLPEAELNAFNRAMKSRDPSLMSLAVTGVAAKFRASVGNEPQQLEGTRPTQSGVALFTSRQEHYAATGSPQYRKDAAFRASVDARLKATYAANPNF